MKKLMISFLAGAILIGTGLGITLLELSDWSVAYYPKYLESTESRQYVADEPVDMEKLDEVEVYLNTMYQNEFRKLSLIDVVEDETCTDNIVLEITYKGHQPDIKTYTYEDYGETALVADDNEPELKYMGQMVIYTGLYDSMAEYKQVIQAMFDSKVFYENMDNCLIESVTVRTAYPDKIKVR